MSCDRVIAQVTLVSTGPWMEGQDMIVSLTSATAVTNGFNVAVRAIDVSTEGAEDYTLVVDNVKFLGNAGEVQHIRIATVNDAMVEGDEDLQIYLTCTDPAVDVRSVLPLTIKDNDKAKLLFSDERVEEGDALVFKVKLTEGVEGGTTVEVRPLEYGTKVLHDGKIGEQRTDIEKVVGKLHEQRDFIADPVRVNFAGSKGEEHEVSFQTLVDFIVPESPELFTVEAIHVGGSAYVDLSSTGTGVILDPTHKKHCPPEDFLKKNTDHELTFFGDGALLSTYKEDADLAANTGVGIRWVEHFPHTAQQQFAFWYRVELEGQVNIASTADSLKAEQDTLFANVMNPSAFGNSVLVPKISGQAADVRLTLYNKQTWGGLVSGLSFRYAGANNYWSRREAVIDSTGAIIDAKPRTGQINAHMFRASIFHDFVNYEQRGEFSVMLRAGYIYHWIRGDLGQPTGEAERILFIGSDQRGHRGWELGLAFRLKNLEADVSYSNLYNQKGCPPVAGLDGGRLVTTIRFVGGFKAKLED
jgi:hypothetical protein